MADRPRFLACTSDDRGLTRSWERADKIPYLPNPPSAATAVTTIPPGVRAGAGAGADSAGISTRYCLRALRRSAGPGLHHSECLLQWLLEELSGVGLRKKLEALFRVVSVTRSILILTGI